MVRNSSRNGRLSDLLHREVAKLIQEEFSNPSYGMITVSGVVINDDLSFAKVYVTVLPEDKTNTSLDALNHAAGYFRTVLSKHLSLRIVPKIKFIYDESLARGARMEQILDSLKDPNQNGVS